MGGSHLATLCLLRALDPARIRPLIVLHDGAGPLSRHLTDAGLRWETLALPALPGESPRRGAIAAAVARTAPGIRHFLRDRGVALVHTNDLRSHLTWAWPARWARRGFLWHSHMVLSGAVSWRLLAAAAHCIVVPSQAALDSLPGNGAAKARVVPGPFDVAPAAPDRKAARAALGSELNLPADAAVVGFVGNMTAQKRPLVFLDAAASMAARSPRRLHFVLAGDDRGGLRADATALARERGVAAHFLGYRNPVEPVLSACDVLIAPGVGDSFGRTLVEAMLAETPVVAADSGGHRDILDNGAGIAVAPDDAVRFADAALQLLADPDRAATLAAAARRSAVARFAAPVVAARIHQIYDEMFAHAVGR